MIVTTLENLQIYDEEIKNYIHNELDKAREVYGYDNYDLFPETGKENKLYLDESEKSIYYWKDTEYVFLCKGKIAERDIVDALGRVPTAVKIVRW